MRWGKYVSAGLALAVLGSSAWFAGTASAQTVGMSGELGPGKSSFSQAEQKYYTSWDWTMAPSRKYTIDLVSSNFDTYLILRDATKVVAVSDDVALGNLNSRIVFTPKQYGTYRIVVTTYAQKATGKFSLRIREEASGAPPVAAGEFTFPPGALTKGDPQFKLRKGCHYKAHHFLFRPGVTYTIDLMSPGKRGDPGWFDTYLFLVDELGNEVARNDDGGDGLNARLIFTPTREEDYRLVVTSFSQGATGRYILRVRWKE
jgi:hypothetical protein